MKILDQNGVSKLVTLIKSSLTSLESFKTALSSVNGVIRGDGNGGFSAVEITDSYIILSSSTADSTKKFKITVDDSGTLTATEVTTTTT